MLSIWGSAWSPRRWASSRSFSASTRGMRARPPLEIDGLPNYNFAPVKVATLFALFWGFAGMAVGVYIAFELAFPDLNIAPWFNFGRLRPLHTSAVIFAFGGNVLLATSFYVVQRTCRARLAGDLAPWFVILGYNFFILIAGTGYLLGITAEQGICGARVVRRPLADDRLGRLPAGVPRHDLAPQGAAYFRRQLVLSRLHPHHRDAAHRQQRRRAGVDVLVQILYRLERRPGCDVPVVVRPQRGRLLPDRRLPRHHVLFRAQAGGAADLFLSAVDHPLLVAHLPLHLGGPASSPLYSLAGLDPDLRHDVLAHAVDALMGRHDQRTSDAVGRLGQAAHRSGASHARGFGRLLRHVDLRRPGDVDQVGELALPLYRLDDRPRAFGRSRLGRVRVVRRRLLPGSVAVEQARALFAAPRQLALLDRDARHRALHHVDVGVGHPARPDVAQLHAARLPRIFVHRDRCGDASLLCHPRDSAACCSSSPTA